jgi:transcriptional regulator with XRE-family HTH domain
MKNTLAEALSEKRDAAGLSARAAARSLGVAPGTYEGWEKGWRTPVDRSHHEALADWLGVSVPVVLYWSGLLTEAELGGLS